MTSDDEKLSTIAVFALALLAMVMLLLWLGGCASRVDSRIADNASTLADVNVRVADNATKLAEIKAEFKMFTSDPSTKAKLSAGRDATNISPSLSGGATVAVAAVALFVVAAAAVVLCVWKWLGKRRTDAELKTTDAMLATVVKGVQTFSPKPDTEIKGMIGHYADHAGIRGTLKRRVADILETT